MANKQTETSAPKTILPDLTATQPANGHMSGLEVKVSEKGAVSIYGIRRFPFTFYRAELELILSKAPELRAFMERNNAKLASKASKAADEGRESL